METNKITLKYIANKKESIDSFLKCQNYSDNNIFYLIKNKKVLINKKEVIDKTILVDLNDEIQVTLLDEINDLPITKNDIEIVYEDEYFLVVNKQSNIEIEPSKNNYENTLSNYVGYYLNKHNINSKIHIVNRLDKLTSGLVIFAKNRYIHNLFSKTKITKKYQALVDGIVSEGTINIKIKKDGKNVKRIIADDGKVSITNYKLIRKVEGNSLVDISLVTGRTHQIRLSFSSIGHPLVNDPLYGNVINDNPMYLKTYYLEFIHPITKKVLKIHI